MIFVLNRFLENILWKFYQFVKCETLSVFFSDFIKWIHWVIKKLGIFIVNFHPVNKHEELDKKIQMSCFKDDWILFQLFLLGLFKSF